MFLDLQNSCDQNRQGEFRQVSTKSAPGPIKMKMKLINSRVVTDLPHMITTRRIGSNASISAVSDYKLLPLSLLLMPGHGVYNAGLRNFTHGACSGSTCFVIKTSGGKAVVTCL